MVAAYSLSPIFAYLSAGSHIFFITRKLQPLIFFVANFTILISFAKAVLKFNQAFLATSKAESRQSWNWNHQISRLLEKLSTPLIQIVARRLQSAKNVFF